jgi:hypothetical protein
VIHCVSRMSEFRWLFRLQVAWFAFACLAWSQTYYSVQEVHVSGLPLVAASSDDPSDILRASLATILHKKSVCCGGDSALGEAVAKADPRSLKDIAAKLQGRHLLGDGRPIQVTAEYLEPSAINSGMLISSLRDQHALLMEWNSHLYVCYGATYRRDYDPGTGVELYTILKFLLQDTRYSESRRKVVFNRETDDWNKVQGMLRVTSSRQ